MTARLRGLRNLKVRRIPAAIWRSARLFPAMSPTHRREYAKITALAALAEVGLRLVSLPRVTSLFGVRLSEEAEGPTGATLDALPDWAVDRLRLVSTVMKRWPVDGTCLRHSLVAGHRLRALSPLLRIGVARADAGFAAHAWLEISGRSVDPTSARYAPLEIDSR